MASSLHSEVSSRARNPELLPRIKDACSPSVRDFSRMYLNVLTNILWESFAVSSAKQIKIVDDSLKELPQAALKEYGGEEQGEVVVDIRYRRGFKWVLIRPWWA